VQQSVKKQEHQQQQQLKRQQEGQGQANGSGGSKTSLGCAASRPSASLLFLKMARDW